MLILVSLKLYQNVDPFGLWRYRAFLNNSKWSILRLPRSTKKKLSNNSLFTNYPRLLKTFSRYIFNFNSQYDKKYQPPIRTLGKIGSQYDIVIQTSRYIIWKSQGRVTLSSESPTGRFEISNGFPIVFYSTFHITRNSFCSLSKPIAS